MKDGMTSEGEGVRRGVGRLTWSDSPVEATLSAAGYIYAQPMSNHSQQSTIKTSIGWRSEFLEKSSSHRSKVSRGVIYHRTPHTHVH